MNKEDPNDCLCPYQRGIPAAECNIPFDCDICGWNPEEEERRKEMLRLMEETGKLVNGEPLRV